MSTTNPHDNPGSFSIPFAANRLGGIVSLGFKSIWNHRLRSLLTALGIVFGVCSVIAMLAIGEGASFEAQEQIRKLGSQNIIVRSVKPPEEKKSTSQQTAMVEYGLLYADVDRIQELVPTVNVDVPAHVIRQDVWNGGKRVDCDIYGTVPWYTEIHNRTMRNGRFFNAIEFDTKANVCVLDKEMAGILFPMDSALGSSVHLGEHYFRVVGIIEEGEALRSALTTTSVDLPRRGASDRASHRMYIPLSTSRERFGNTILERKSGSESLERVELHELTVQVASMDKVVETASIIDSILKHHHKREDYEIIVPLKLLQQAERTKQIFNIVLGGIAALSLLVGGIGIMNIMLASVTERTREIGIRRALGARRNDIVFQFLVETVILSGVGGLIGVGLGLVIPFLVEVFANMETIVTPWSPFVAFSISALVGVVFGLYPALRAADMDPVEALRHE